ncbi:MAG: RimK/LysX family protein [Nanoarchaeota archaeon]|nr:RimK/LysX family protein [Nanoarchaeota archaeon]MBU1135602.1 RimK/LysX family protein [Nanoarchaeota archaeon]MBU2519784.1 RimK/LysX family protein [Nanoarchaeota archaeon]
MKIVGIIEEIELKGKNKIKTLALFDTGARLCSVDKMLAEEAGLGPKIRTTRVRFASSKNHVRRDVVKAKIKINGFEFNTEVNIQDRSHMTFPMIIGRNVIKGNFIVDCSKNLELFEKRIKEIEKKNKKQKSMVDFK